MNNITTIWKEFNEDQDKKDLFAKAELDGNLIYFVQRASSLSIFGSKLAYEDLKMVNKKEQAEIKIKHGIMERTLENALTWYNNK